MTTEPIIEISKAKTSGSYGWRIVVPIGVSLDDALCLIQVINDELIDRFGNTSRATSTRVKVDRTGAILEAIRDNFGKFTKSTVTAHVGGRAEDTRALVDQLIASGEIVLVGKHLCINPTPSRSAKP